VVEGEARCGLWVTEGENRRRKKSFETQERCDKKE
jgi:hypothetical protein